MPAAQQLLFPDPQPLVERLGREFFRGLPRSPGVYLMRDAQDTVLYVGKAKSLRQRLGSYRVANPDRMARRHLRLLRLVSRIELQECADEAAALAREAELLRELRPRFNRAGTWPSTPRLLAWSPTRESLRLTVVENGVDGWRTHGPFGSTVWVLRAVLARLLWVVAHPQLGYSGLPVGWNRGELEPECVIPLEDESADFSSKLEMLTLGQVLEFCEWIRAALPTDMAAFERTALETDVEFLLEGGAAPSKKLTGARKI